MAFSKFTLDPESMGDTVEECHHVLKRRSEICGDDINARTWSPISLKTFLNGLAAAFKDGGHPGAFVPSSPRQFPRFNKYLASCITRHKARQAISVVQHGEMPPITDDEMLTLVDKMVPTNVHSVQRNNILLFLYNTGLRGESLVLALVTKPGLPIVRTEPVVPIAPHNWMGPVAGLQIASKVHADETVSLIHGFKQLCPYTVSCKKPCMGHSFLHKIDTDFGRSPVAFKADLITHSQTRVFARLA